MEAGHCEEALQQVRGTVGWCHSSSWTKAVVVIRSGHGHCVAGSGKNGRLTGTMLTRCESPSWG
eukprot:1752592-Prorocentrum_lima.AAC.1